MVGTFPVFQPGGPGSIPSGVKIVIFGCVSFVSVLSCVASGSGPDSERPALVYLSSVLVQSVATLTHLTHWHLGLSPGGCKSYIGEGR